MKKRIKRANVDTIDTTEEARDELGELILAKGLAPNMYLLDLDSSLCVPDNFELPSPWNLPSRMFQFPIEVHGPEADYPRQIGLRHPLLADHPYVKHVEVVLGMTLSREPVFNDCGYSSAELAQWWHAVDLVSSGHCKDLIATAHFTHPQAMFQAVAHGLRYTHNNGQRLATQEARMIMVALGAKEPLDRSATVRQLSKPQACRSDDKSEHWPINSGPPSADDNEAWAFIFGVEDGWFMYNRSGYLEWSVLGRERYAAGDAKTYTHADGQGAFAF